MKFSEGNAQQQAAMLVFRADNKQKYTEQFPYCDAFQAGVDLLERLFCKRWPAVEDKAKRLLSLIVIRAWDRYDPVHFLHMWAIKALNYNRMVGLGIDSLLEIFAEEGELEPVDNVPQKQKSRQELKAFDEAIEQGYTVPLETQDMDYYGRIFPN